MSRPGLPLGVLPGARAGAPCAQRAPCWTPSLVAKACQVSLRCDDALGRLAITRTCSVKRSTTGLTVRPLTLISVTQAEANGLAWQEGVRRLDAAQAAWSGPNPRCLAPRRIGPSRWWKPCCNCKTSGAASRYSPLTVSAPACEPDCRRRGQSIHHHAQGHQRVDGPHRRVGLRQ